MNWKAWRLPALAVLLLVLTSSLGIFWWRSSSYDHESASDSWLRKEFEALRGEVHRMAEVVHRAGVASNPQNDKELPAPEQLTDSTLASRLNSLERRVGELGATIELRDELYNHGSQVTSQNLSTAEVYVGAVGVLFTVIGFLFVLASYSTYKETKDELKSSREEVKTLLADSRTALQRASKARKSLKLQTTKTDQKVNRASQMSEAQYGMLQRVIAALEQKHVIDEPTGAALRLDVEVLEKRVQLLHPDLGRVKDALQYFAYKYVEDAKVELDEVMKRVAHDDELRRLVNHALSPRPAKADIKPPPPASHTESEPDPKDGSDPKDQK